MFFWTEVDKLTHKYQSLSPSGLLDEGYSTTGSQSGPPSPRETSEVDQRLVIAAALNCIKLTRQCIGEEAPWRSKMWRILLCESARRCICEQRGILSLRCCLVAAQNEIFDILRKDPYPRFLLTPMFAELNRNGTLKELLSVEKLEIEMRRFTSVSPKRSLSLSGDLQSQQLDNSSFLDNNHFVHERRLTVDTRKLSKQDNIKDQRRPTLEASLPELENLDSQPQI